MIAETEALRAKAAQARIFPERAVELHFRATVEKVHGSTTIEGNPLTLKQVDAVLRGQSTDRRKYAETEVRNYKKALDYIEKRKLVGLPLEYGDIMKLHELAMKDLLPSEKTGVLRTGSIYIVDQDDRVKYTGPGAKTVQKKLEALIAWLDTMGESIHPCIGAAILHYQFVSIHPFADGNGRTTRLLTMLYLGMRGYDFGGSIVLDSYYAQAQGEYYAALSNCHGDKYREGHELTSWVSYFMSGFLSSARVLWAQIAILLTFEPLVDKKRMSQDGVDLLTYALQFGSIALSEAEEILPHISRRTLQRKLKELSNNGFLVQKGAARSTRYYWVE